MGVWGRVRTHICMAESLCHSPETITTLLVDCIPIQNKKFKKRKTHDSLHSACLLVLSVWVCLCVSVSICVISEVCSEEEDGNNSETWFFLKSFLNWSRVDPRYCVSGIQQWFRYKYDLDSFSISVNSGSWWWTGRPGMLRFMGSQRVGHDWATDLIW